MENLIFLCSIFLRRNTEQTYFCEKPFIFAYTKKYNNLKHEQ